MVISEKQKSMSWQVKTKDGQYYQPDSLVSLYSWIFEARLCPDDSIFSAKQNDWVQLSNMPELVYCFWQLMGSDGNVYGPISIGELKQLYLNNQVSNADKIAIYGSDTWREIKDIAVLGKWFGDSESTVIDYVQLVEKIHDEYSKKHETKEEIFKKPEVPAAAASDQKKYIKELESEKLKLEKSLSDSNIAFQELSSKVNQYKLQYDSVQEELKLLRIDVQEKTNAVEQLNKQNAQAEVTHTLKDDEINQLRSNVKLLQTEIQSIRASDGQNTNLSSGGINDTISELTSENKKLSASIVELEQVVSEKEKAISDIENTLNRALNEKEELSQKFLSLEKIITEKENLISSLNDTTSDSLKQISEDLMNKDVELRGLHKKIEEKSSELSLYVENSKKLQCELEKADIQIREDAVTIKDLKDILNSREIDISAISEKLSARDEEIAGYKDSVLQGAGEISRLKSELADLNNAFSDKKIKIDSLEDIINSKENEIKELKDNISAENSNKNALLMEIENIKQYSEKLKTVISGYEIEVEKTNKTLYEKNEYIAQAEKNNAILLQEKEDIKSEYNARLKEIEQTNESRVQDLNSELNNVNDVLAQRDQDILSQKTEICRLNDAAIDQDKQWQDKIKVVNDELMRLSAQFEAEKEALRTEFNNQMSIVEREKNIASERIVELENGKNKLSDQLDSLQKEILDKNRIIESIKEDARNNENVLKVKIHDLDQELIQAKENSEVLYQKGKDLETKIQDGITREEELKREILLVKQELEKTKGDLIQMEKENEEFVQIKSGLESKLADATRDLEKAEEENKISQRQFYLDKQKMSKEYNDMISKLDKLQKRTILEREIQDRSKMKTELERLYNLLRENFEGIQKGVAEIQLSFQNLSEDIDGKNLSLKYLVETEKRENKKGQFSKSDSDDEPDTSV
jgi:chromosome segregation ATPase